MKQQVQLSFVDAIKKGLVVNYCNFTGRASRSEFWWMYLVSTIIGGASFGVGSIDSISLFMGLINLLLFLPMVGVTVRRLHDIGKGGGWIFIYLIPIAGLIISIIWNVRPSDPGDNRFGPEPNVIDIPDNPYTQA